MPNNSAVLADVIDPRNLLAMAMLSMTLRKARSSSYKEISVPRYPLSS